MKIIYHITLTFESHERTWKAPYEYSFATEEEAIREGEQLITNPRIDYQDGGYIQINSYEIVKREYADDEKSS